jgi:2-keto-4-pentenoate hydratase/2-oxohepta-3-ene-1,7-dioic acid hydratase (catechol pathway)
MAGFGVFSVAAGEPRVGWRSGDEVVDLSALGAVFRSDSLNPLMAQGPGPGLTRSAARASTTGRAHASTRRRSSFRSTVPGYVDFYSSLEHATNIGRMFRPGAEPLPRNWRWLPAGYDGRAGSVVVSGTDVVRPRGQFADEDGVPVYAPSKRLDFELELGFVVGVPSRRGEPIPADRFAEHVFGVVVVNDWSARDIQAWETVPLGPFLGKSFLTSVSAWVTPLELLEEHRVEAPVQDPPPLPYLAAGRDWALDVDPRGRAQRHGRLARQRTDAVLDDAAAARARDLERLAGAHRRPDGLGHDLGAGPRLRGSLIELTRNGTDRSCCRTRPRGRFSRTETRSSCAPTRQPRARRGARPRRRLDLEADRSYRFHTATHSRFVPIGAMVRAGNGEHPPQRSGSGREATLGRPSRTART